MTAGLRPAVFLDRDGTLLVEKDYISDPDDVELIPSAPGALQALRDAGYLLVVVTNQSGIARGLYTEEDYRMVAARLDDLLEEAGLLLDAVQYCPHHPKHTGYCACRKPATGMYLAAAAALAIGLHHSWYVGDKVSDVLPALELGGRGILVRTGHGREQEARVPEEVAVVDDVGEAATLILSS